MDRKGVDIFHRWIRESIAENKPIDQFVREILTARGSTYQNPAEFELNTESDSLRIEPGKDVKLKISIDRDGYNGPVKFAITTPVDGVSISDAIARKGTNEATVKLALNEAANPGTTFPIKISGYRGEKEDAPRAPLYTQGYWKNQFRDLYSPMFEFEDTIWVTVLPVTGEKKPEKEDEVG